MYISILSQENILLTYHSIVMHKKNNIVGNVPNVMSGLVINCAMVFTEDTLSE